MTAPFCVRALLWTFVAGVVVTACASAPKPSAATMVVSASADTNPDAGGRPSPIVVRVYQLKGDAAFSGADFFALFDDEQKVLGPDLIGRAEYVMAPSERRSVELAVSPEARFVGAIAAFRDIRNSQWRVVVPVTPDHEMVTIGVERARIALSAAD